MAVQTRLPNFRSFAARSATLAGLLVFAVAAAAAGPAHAACPNAPPGTSQADPYPALKQAVGAYSVLRQKAEGFSGIGMHVSLSPQGPDYDVAGGSTSFRHGQPICPDTLFQIGSITKSFTSVLILKLEAAGVLNINQTLGRWLPQYPAWSSTTIKQLLNLTAPPANFYDEPAYQKDVVADIHRTFTPAQLVGYVYPYTDTAPWHYSNTNYILAGMIVAKATGMSYADALKKMILEPLHLDETYYQPRVAPKRVLDAMASGYDDQSLCYELFHLLPPCAQQPLDDLLGHDLKTQNLSAYGATGGIVASLRDVTSWVRALFGDRLLPLRQRVELFSLVSQASGQPIATTSPDDRLGFSLGVGQIYNRFSGGPVWYYEGSTQGYRVIWYRRPGDDLVVAFALNSSAYPDEEILLYQAALGILEPQIAIGASAPPASPGN
jgi:D-alanyl-D-alanine carboxypeptidase